MNKSDLKLIIILVGVCFLVLLGFNVFEKKDKKTALVYYNSDLILKIDLQIKDKKEYVVNGYNGKVKIIASNGKVKVANENSPLHLCSKQGYISKSYETIVCLPNKITIKISSDTSLDAVVK